MAILPTGTVTFFFTDIQGSTRLWEQHPQAMRVALPRHDALLRETIEANRGIVFKTVGDAFCAAFATAPDALKAALAAQQRLLSEVWPEPATLRVRMALHTGVAELWDNDYFGQPLNRVARLLGAGHGGQILLSHVIQELLRDTLPPGASLQDMGEHALRGLGRPERIFQLLYPGLPSEFPPLKSLDYLPNNLPQQDTSFIGREQETAEVKALLEQSRLLTLTGSGGSGKSRLALQVAAEALEQFPEGVWLVELAALSDPALVPHTVASILRIREQAGKTLIHSLVETLKTKHMLLLLDNCEHLLVACAQLADALVRACPNVKILASSREALGIAGEQTYRVPTLSLPDPQQAANVASVSRSEAVQLFIERARLLKSDFVVTDPIAPALASVCHRLDGIPLAIELAAARIRSLSVQAIAARLDDRFHLLTGGSKLVMPRQQTLQAAIDWSYDLLTEPERALLARLSVFAGGWTLEAAEQVGAGDISPHGSIEAEDIFEVLTSLTDKSLVIADTEREKARYRLLETVRQYAGDRLAEREERAEFRARHRDHFLALAEEANEKLAGPEQAHWLAVLEEEHDNLRLALAFCLEEPEGGEAGLRLGAALQEFWWTRGHLSEGREHFAALLAHPGAQAHTRMRANALNGAAVLAYYQGDYASARARFEECLAIHRELGKGLGIAAALSNLGSVLFEQGEYASARALFAESLEILRTQGDRLSMAYSLGNLGNVAFLQGDYASARTMQEECLAIQREFGDRQGIANSLSNLGNIAFAQGDYPLARSLFVQGLAIQREMGNRRGIAASLEAFGSLAVTEQRPERAARLWGATLTLCAAIGLNLPSHERERYEREAEAVKQALGEAAFHAAWQEGSALTWEQAIAYALESRTDP